MSKTTTARARVEPELKEQAEGVLSRLGLSASDAINLFYRQIVLNNGLPFEVKLPNTATREAIDDVRKRKDLTTVGDVAALKRATS